MAILLVFHTPSERFGLVTEGPQLLMRENERKPVTAADLFGNIDGELAFSRQFNCPAPSRAELGTISAPAYD
jgi:hypothetical protein